MKCKKQISLVLVLCMILSLLPISALAVETPLANTPISSLTVGASTIEKFTDGSGTKANPYKVTADTYSYKQTDIKLTTSEKVTEVGYCSYKSAESETWNEEIKFQRQQSDNSELIYTYTSDDLNENNNKFRIMLYANDSSVATVIEITLQEVEKIPKPYINTEYYASHGNKNRPANWIANSNVEVYLSNNNEYEEINSDNIKVYWGPNYTQLADPSSVSYKRGLIHIDFDDPITEPITFKVAIQLDENRISELSDTINVIPSTINPIITMKDKEVRVEKGVQTVSIPVIEMGSYDSVSVNAYSSYDDYTDPDPRITGSYKEGPNDEGTIILTYNEDGGWPLDGNTDYYIALTGTKNNVVFGQSSSIVVTVKGRSDDATIENAFGDVGNDGKDKVSFDGTGTGTETDPYIGLLEINESQTIVNLEIRTTDLYAKPECCVDKNKILDSYYSDGYASWEISADLKEVLIKVTSEDGTKTIYYKIKIEKMDFDIMQTLNEVYDEANQNQSVIAAIKDSNIYPYSDDLATAMTAIRAKAKEQLEYYQSYAGTENNPTLQLFKNKNIQVENDSKIRYIVKYYLYFKIDEYSIEKGVYRFTVTPRINLEATIADRNNHFVYEGTDSNTVTLGNPIDVKISDCRLKICLPADFEVKSDLIYTKYSDGQWIQTSYDSEINSEDDVNVEKWIATIETEFPNSIEVRKDYVYKAYIWMDANIYVFDSVQSAIDAIPADADISENEINVSEFATVEDMKNLTPPTNGCKDFIIIFYENEIITAKDITFIPKTVGGVTYTVTKTGEDFNSATYAVTATGGSSSGSSSSSSSSTDPGTLKPEVTPNKDGQVNTTIQTQAVTDGIKDAQKKGDDNVVITPQVSGDADQVTVTVPKIAVSDVGKAGLGLTVETDLGNVTLPESALKALAREDGSRVSITVGAKDDGTTNIEVKVGNNVIDTLKGGLSVELPSTSGNVMVVVDKDGNETIVKKSVVDGEIARALLEGSCTVKTIDNSKQFSDVGASWYKDAVDFASSHELFQGVTSTEFAPDAPMSRAMLATVLYRLEDATATDSAGLFQDVGEASWFSDSVAWASANGIVQGYGDGTFGPDNNITREQLCTMLYRYAKLVGLDTKSTGDLSSFNDAGSVSSYATEAMQWAVGNGLVQGMDNGGLNPSGNATRAQVAQIAERLITLMVK